MQKITLVVHFNVSQADEWAGKGMISESSALHKAITSFEQRVIPQVDQLVFVSAYMQKQVQGRIPSIVNVNQQVIANFVADPSAQSSSIVAADLIAIGTLEPRKNQSYLLDIVAAAKESGKQLTLTLVGDGPNRAMLESKAKLLKINEQVDFKGFLPNASSLIAKHQACIHVAKIENLPVTLIEALAYAKPIFASAVGGIPEVFEDGLQGRVLPLDNAVLAAQIIIETLQDKDAVAQYGVAARMRFVSHFEQNLIGNRLCKFITTAIKVI